MSRLTALLGMIPRLPTVMRTLRHLRADQTRAQIHHMIFGLPEPHKSALPAPDLAVTRPATPFLMPAPHIGVTTNEQFTGLTLLSCEITLPMNLARHDWTDAPHGPLVAYHLHEQAYLRHAALTPARRADVMIDWIDRHQAGIGWDPHPISLRLLSWGKLLLSAGALPDDPALRSRLHRSMADQTSTLARGIEVRLQANHLLSNLIGVVWAGLLFGGEEAQEWLAYEGQLLSELDAQIAADGGHEERSPMYHSLILENILDLLNLAIASPNGSDELVRALSRVAERMTSGLGVYAGRDDRIALFADSGWGVAAEPPALFGYAHALNIARSGVGLDQTGSVVMRETGYVRLSSGDFDLLVSAAGPSPAHQPGHAHCDALAFELSLAGERLISDTGVFEYRPGARRDCARSTAAHATLQFGSSEQSETWSAHRVGGRVSVDPVEQLEDGTHRFAATGWGSSAARHQRDLRVTPDGVEITDRVEAIGKKITSRLPFAPGWSLEEAENGFIARHVAQILAVMIALPPGLEWSVESAPFFPTFHQEVERQVLVGRGETPIDGSIRITRLLG